MLIVPANECPPNQDRNPLIGCEQSPSGNAPVRTHERADRQWIAALDPVSRPRVTWTDKRIENRHGGLRWWLSTRELSSLCGAVFQCDATFSGPSELSPNKVESSESSCRSTVWGRAAGGSIAICPAPRSGVARRRTVSLLSLSLRGVRAACIVVKLAADSVVTSPRSSCRRRSRSTPF